MNSKYYALQVAEKTADIYIFGDITDWKWLESDVTAYGLAKEIEQLGEVDVINVHIDSYGGIVSEGWAIYNALMHHPARVVTYADGFVASAAIFPFLAGEERRASNVSAFYLHEGWMHASGYADDLRAAADQLDTLTDIGINAFTARTNMSAETVKELMAAETWLTPAQALDYGIATAIVADAAARQGQQSAKRQIMQRVLGAAPPAPTPPEQKAKPAPEPLPGIMQTLTGFFDAKNHKNERSYKTKNGY